MSPPRERPPGTVYLVGGGPGDPGLLTLRAAQLLARADVVVYDALIGEGVLALCGAGAERVFVGKRAGGPSASQASINVRLVDLARRHPVVVRLKGGDPFVFGRGGEEALALVRAGVPFEVVPGITAGIAAPAYAGIPVTHRGTASSVAFVTGHEDPDKEDSDLDWAHLAKGVGTVVFYMGVGRMQANFERLIGAGRDRGTPAAVIEWGTCPRQRTVSGTLSSLPSRAQQARMGAPALVVVGDVVALREQLAWFDRRPLSGRHIVVTRARAQVSDVAAHLEALGAQVIQYPTIRIIAPADPEPLRQAVREVERFDWVVFTSVNGVAGFWTELDDAGRDARALAGVRVCAIGPATAGALGNRGIRADLVPERFVAEAVLDALAAHDLKGREVLLPRAEVARDLLPDGLRAAGARVREVTAYRTVPDAEGTERMRDALRDGRVDLVTFTASSTVRNFVDLVGTEIGRAEVATIGPITSGTARELGLPVHVEAREFTIPGLVQSIRDHYAEAAEE